MNPMRIFQDTSIRFGRTSLAVVLVVMVTACGSPQAPQQQSSEADISVNALDIVLTGGRVIDPETGLDGIRDVGIKGRQIVAVSEQSLAADLGEDGELIDVSDMVVAPGFIDLHVHGHSDDARRYQALDGVTTALEQEWGIPAVGAFLKSREGKSRINFGSSVSHGNLRTIALADADEQVVVREVFTREASGENPLWAANAVSADVRYEALGEDRFELLHREMARDMADGGLGIGMAHQYYPGATREEIYSVFQFAAEKQVPIFVHVRDMSIDAMQEVIANAASTGASLHIVHVNSMSLGKIATVLEMIAGARERGIDITTEAYPYTAASTSIDAAIFDGDWRGKLGVSYDAIQWEQTGERLTEETFNKYRGTGGTVIMHMMQEPWIELAMATPWVIVASDGMPYAPGAHPRTAGTYARVLGRYVRERAAVDLPTAISKMSYLPAKRLEHISSQMAQKGRLQAGFDADITVFDPASVTDTATFKSLGYSQGIEYVLVNGVPVVRDGELVPDTYPGEAIRSD